MPSLDVLAGRGIVRMGEVRGGYVSPDGKATRADFDGGWIGLGKAGNASPGDRYVSLYYSPVSVRIVQTYIGERIAIEDVPAVRAALEAAMA